MKKKTSPTRNSMNRSPVRHGLFLTALVLVCFALSPQVRADCQHACLDNLNTAFGDDALVNLVSGVANTAVGGIALEFNTDGHYNTAVGFGALQFNTTGIENTAIGYGALPNNTTGQYNVAAGRSALYYNTTGSNNTAIAYSALEENTIGQNNTGIGFSALRGNIDGEANTAIGQSALLHNKDGSGNTANGDSALLNNKHGSKNIALGSNAGKNLVAGNDNIYIGSHGIQRESDAIRIGINGTQTTTFIAGISGTTVAGGVGVIIDTNGHLGTVVSSERFKDAVKPMGKASEAILALQPVTFRYKKELDPEGIPQFGLVAEEVEKVNPDLVARDEQGKPYTVRYEAVNAMLLNEFLKQHNEFLKEHQKVQRLEAALAAVNERLEAQDAKIDKVNAKVELTKPAPQMVVNDQ